MSSSPVPTPKKTLPPTYLLLAVMLMVGMHVLLPSVILLPLPWKAVGAFLMASGIAINLMGNNTFKHHQTTIKPFQTSSALVTTGIFRYSRNPMYLGMVALLVGLGLLLGSGPPFVVVPIFVLLITQRFIHVEEQMLADTFDATYHAYCKRVRRWI